RRTRRWADKLRLWFMPPGWRPADVAARFPKPAFDIARVQRFETAVPRRVQVLAAGLFLLVLGATSGFLWFAQAMSNGQRAAGAAALVGALWLIGRLLERGAVAQAAGAAVLVADGESPDASSAAGRASR
ncbi:MAG: hypothetical protein ACKO3M_00065, partial [Rubrivivax sp.]